MSETDRYLAAKNLYESGRFAEAETLCRNLLRENKEHSGALHYLGLIANHFGSRMEAIKLVTRATQLDSNDAEAMNSLGMLHIMGGNVDIAIKTFEEAIARCGTYVDACTNLGAAYIEVGQFESAISALNKALETEPDNENALRNLAHIYFKTKKYTACARLYEKILDNAPNDVSALLNLAATQGIHGDSESSIRSYRKALMIDPQNIRAINDLGVTYSETGQEDDALSQFNSALEINRDNIDSYYHLSATTKGLSDDQLSYLTNRINSLRPGNVELTRAYFAIAKENEKRREYSEAIKFYKLGNKTRQSTMTSLGVHYKDTSQDELVAKIIKKFPLGNYRSNLKKDPIDKILIFVIGMPRSGTTLINQILSAHSEIQSIGESEALGQAIGQKKDSTDAAKYFMANLGELDVNGVVNKLPFNYLHVGSILEMFPNARIIHTIRDWRDVALSCFFHNFTDNHPWSTDLQDIKHYISAYQKISEHWQKLYGSIILEVEYKKLVETFENECRRIIKFSGFAWEDQCLTFHQQKNTVQTASKWQVRQPIYNSSIDRWKNYQTLLGDYFDNVN